MHELITYTPSDFTDLASLMQELSSNIIFTRESLERMLASSFRLAKSYLRLKDDTAESIWEKEF